MLSKSCRVKLTVLPVNLRLRDDQLAGVVVVGASQRVLQDADSAEHVADNLNLVGEVGWVTQDHAGLGLELHLGLDAGHGGLDTSGLVALVKDLVDLGVEHVRATVDSRETGEALRKLAKTVQGVDVRGLAVPGNRVTVQADPLDGLSSLTRLLDVAIVQVQGHGMADEVPSGGLKAELVVDILHRAILEVKTCHTEK